MEERLGEMRKGRRERSEKGSHCFFSPQDMTSWSSSIKIGFFFKLIEALLKKRYVITLCKNMCHCVIN